MPQPSEVTPLRTTRRFPPLEESSSATAVTCCIRDPQQFELRPEPPNFKHVYKRNVCARVAMADCRWLQHGWLPSCCFCILTLNKHLPTASRCVDATACTGRLHMCGRSGSQVFHVQADVLTFDANGRLQPGASLDDYHRTRAACETICRHSGITDY